MEDKTILRARDFWASLVLITVSLFFLYKTTDIPFLETSVAGVDAADWYNSAALVPYGIFAALFILAVTLLVISIRDGGAAHALSMIGIGYSSQELFRVFCIALILFIYIFALVPRVDFILSSALMITSLIWGFHNEDRRAMLVGAGVVSMTGAYALIMNFPVSEWAKPHDDDWITLFAFSLLTTIMILTEYRAESLSRVVRVTPVVAVMAPLILVCAMAFGFRQNVPNRTGLVFSKIEYHYYVTLRPLWQGKR